jgi:hypothetical protein
MIENHLATKQPSANARRLVIFLAHLIGVCIIFILPEVLMSRSNPDHGDASLFMYVKSLTYVALFYINFYIIIDRCLNKSNWVIRVIGWNVIAVLAILLISTLIGSFSQHPPYPADAQREDTFRHLSFVTRDIVMSVLTVTLCIAVKLTQRWATIEQQQRDLESSRQAQELKSLKSQLNPHFLFNTLNALYALIDQSPEKAQEAVHRLSGLLRYVLYENNAEVRVADELKFIDNYVKLMKMRLGDNITLNVTLDAGDCAERHIAPLIFISPVENAFKHANRVTEDSHIDIAIIASDDTINCMIINSFNPEAENHDENRAGIGHENLRRRLNLIYGDRATLNTDIDGTNYCLTLSIDLN